MLTEFQALLGGRVRDTWASEMTTWGTLVKLYRDYAEGWQRSFLTVKQRKMLNIKTDATEQFTLNYCDMVIQAMAERLTVASIDGDNDDASAWAGKVLAFNRFDGSQMDVTEASVGDGVTFVMVGFDNKAQLPTITHEPAWDGETGLIPVYDRLGANLIAALKVWVEASGKRANLYLPDRIQKYSVTDTGELRLQAAVSWTSRDGTPLGVPVVAFTNRKKGYGRSEIAAVIPSQDSLNRSVIDMVMTSGLTAFQIKFALGFTPPENLAPGDWVVAGEDGVPDGQKVDAKVLEQGQLVPFIQQCQFHIDQIGTVSRTPLPRFGVAAQESGEAKKQNEVGLIGKVERYQVKAGNHWEDVMAMAARVQTAYGVKLPPQTATWTCTWEDAEKRNDMVLIEIAEKVEHIIGLEETLRLIAPVLKYDEARILKVLAGIKAERQQWMRDAINSLPNFANVDTFEPVGSGFGAN